MKYKVIFGTGSFAKLLNWFIENDTSENIDFFCTEDEFFTEEYFCGKPVKKYSELKKLKKHYEIEILLGIGYIHMNNVRKRIFEMCKNDGFRIGSYIHSSNIINAEVLGEGNIILENNLIEPFTKIGDGNLIWYRTCIAHDINIGNFNTIAGCASLCGNVNVGNNCFIGNSACIKDGVTISDYTLVGAACYVKENTSPHAVIAANAGVCLKERKSIDYI